MAKNKMQLTKEQIELGAKYLAMSNMCTLDPYQKKITDLDSMKRYVHTAWEDAVVGTMEGQEGGYDDAFESQAIDMVEEEIKSFRDDLKAGGKRAAYWIETLQKEVPFLFAEAEQKSVA